MRRSTPRLARLACALALAMLSQHAAAQEALVFRLSGGDEARPLTEAEIAQLGDPLFKLVLLQNPPPVSLSEIEQAIQPDAAKRRTFVVSEAIHQAGGPEAARAVLAFTGKGPGGVDVNGKVFLSVFFTPSPEGTSSLTFPDLQAVEALAWDEATGVYNYYKLERIHGAGFQWEFRGSSKDVDILAPEVRSSTCFACHVNGAPVMKELLFPWNNWHSGTNLVAGLDSPDDAQRWPVARSDIGDPRLSQRLGRADALETMILPALGRFNRARLKSLTSPPGGDGQATITDAKRVLRPLFETTEVNLVSSRHKSGMNPFSGESTGTPGTAICPPTSFFLNVELLGKLGIDEARGFAGPAACQETNPFAIKPEEYRDLAAAWRTKPGRQPARGRALRLVRAGGRFHRQQHGCTADS